MLKAKLTIRDIIKQTDISEGHLIIKHIKKIFLMPKIVLSHLICERANHLLYMQDGEEKWSLDMLLLESSRCKKLCLV